MFRKPDGAGKGDAPRPTNWDKFSENFDNIFKKKQNDEPKKQEDKPDGEVMLHDGKNYCLINDLTILLLPEIICIW